MLVEVLDTVEEIKMEKVEAAEEAPGTCGRWISQAVT